MYLLKRYEAVDWVQIRKFNRKWKVKHSLTLQCLKFELRKCKRYVRCAQHLRLSLCLKLRQEFLKPFLETNYIFKRQLFRQPWDNCGTTLRQLWYYFGTPLKHLFGTAFGQLWNIHGHLWDNWKQLLDKFGNLWGNLGQLWDNFETTLGQLWTNVETTLVQLWDNWIQLWRNFETNPG